jgi:low affinity Fe/Cu permease
MLIPMKKRIEDTFAWLAAKTAEATGSFWAFFAAMLVIVVWGATGPLFGYSDTWQLVINTGTTIVTFLMVFVIQHAQNKDMRAVQLKLNELIASMEGASNRLIDVEDLSDEELRLLYRNYCHLAQTAQRLSPGAKLSIESAGEKRGVSQRVLGDEDESALLRAAARRGRRGGHAFKHHKR